MNYIHKQIVKTSCVRLFSSSPPPPSPNNNPFPSWKLIAALSTFGFYHHYKRVYK